MSDGTFTKSSGFISRINLVKRPYEMSGEGKKKKLIGQTYKCGPVRFFIADGAAMQRGI